MNNTDKPPRRCLAVAKYFAAAALALAMSHGSATAEQTNPALPPTSLPPGAADSDKPTPLANDTASNADELFAQLFADPQPKLKITPEQGVGFGDAEHSMQDPSNVIKVGDTYYIWISWRPIDVHPYNSEIHYATSKDGKTWEEKGFALGKGAPGNWDEWGVLTPYVAEADGRFYMFYTGSDRDKLKGSGNSIGLAVADNPAGPWTRVSDQPVLEPSTDPKAWDHNIVDDAHVIKRDGKFWMYYKGHPGNKHWTLTQQGVAFADKIEGPYKKYEGNPVIKSGHCATVWPHAGGVAAISDIQSELLWAEDGLNFVVLKRGGFHHAGPGPYDPDAHTDAAFGRGITWGVMQWGDPPVDNKSRNIIARFDMNLQAKPQED